MSLCPPLTQRHLTWDQTLHYALTAVAFEDKEKTGKSLETRAVFSHIRR
jgi:hypothetical protein